MEAKTKKKVIIGGAIITIVVAVYLLWKRNQKTTSVAILPLEPTTTTPIDIPKTPNTLPIPATKEKPISKYGYKYGDAVYTRPNVDKTAIYSYPQIGSRYIIRLVDRQAGSIARYLSDATAEGWIVVGMGSPMKSYYLKTTDVTNIKP